jgi:hypothetical protein
MERLLLLLTFALSFSAHAEGTLSFTMQNGDGFQKLEVTETKGVREGSFYSGSNKVPLKSYKESNQLVMKFGKDTDYLDIKEFASYVRYTGTFWQGKQTSIDSFNRAFNGFQIKGKIGDTDFDVVSTPLTKTITMKWDKFFLSISADPNPRKSDGSCRGTLSSETPERSVEVAKFICKSSGSLKDALFKSDQDVLFWLVHLFILPEE